MPRPGYKTTEHAITWAVIVLAAVAMFRGRESSERMVAAVSAAASAGMYCHARAKAKAQARPLDLTELLADAFEHRDRPDGAGRPR